MAWLVALLGALAGWALAQVQRAPRGRLHLTIGPFAWKGGGGGGDMANVVLTTEQKVRVTIQPMTAAGNPAPVDGVPQWSSDGPAATVVADADGLGVFIVSGDVGSSTVTVSADADLGAGVETITAQVQVTTEHAKATQLGLSVGTPELK